MTRSWDVTSNEGAISGKILIDHSPLVPINRTFQTRRLDREHGWMDGIHERRESYGGPSWFEVK